MNNLNLHVRNATLDDLERVAELEANIFGAQSIIPFTHEHFSAWLEVYPQGFFVAEQDKKVVGYTYTQVINCNQDDPRELGRWKSFDEMNDKGFTRASHKNDGNYHLGVNIGSAVPGAGRVLVEALVKLGQSLNKPLLGMSRISGFRAYMQDLVGAGIIQASVDPATQNEIALYYTLECAKLVGRSVRLMPGSAGINGLGLSVLPQPKTPDPVLCKYLRNSHFAVWALLPAFIDDPASLNFSVLIGPAK